MTKDDKLQMQCNGIELAVGQIWKYEADHLGPYYAVHEIIHIGPTMVTARVIDGLTVGDQIASSIGLDYADQFWTLMTRQFCAVCEEYKVIEGDYVCAECRV